MLKKETEQLVFVFLPSLLFQLSSMGSQLLEVHIFVKSSVKIHIIKEI